MNIHAKFLILTVAIVFVGSCTLPNFPTAPIANTPSPNIELIVRQTMTALFVASPTITFTPVTLPTNSPVIEQSITSVVPITGALPTDPIPYVYAPQNTNCRVGPDVIYKAVGYLMKNEISEIVARNPEGTWVAISNLDDPGICYVSLSVVEVYGIDSIMTLTVFTPLPPPTFTRTSPPPTFTRTPHPTITYTPELPTAPGPDDPHVDVSPPSGPISTTYELKIIDFDPGEIVTINIVFIVSAGNYQTIDTFQVTMGGDGNFTTSWTSKIGDPVGDYYVQAIGGNGIKNAITEFAVE